MPKLKYTPSWKIYEKDLHSEDPDVARKAADQFYFERQNELRNDPQARRWEESRREMVVKDKPIWKKQRLQEEKERDQRIINQLRDGGYLMQGLRPAMGLMLVRTIKQKEATDGGIFLPENVKYESNICEAIRLGDELVTPQYIIKPPCNEGDHCLVRENAGLNLKIKGEPVLLIRFDEVLGVLE